MSEREIRYSGGRRINRGNIMNGSQKSIADQNKSEHQYGDLLLYAIENGIDKQEIDVAAEANLFIQNCDNNERRKKLRNILDYLIKSALDKGQMTICYRPGEDPEVETFLVTGDEFVFGCDDYINKSIPEVLLKKGNPETTRLYVDLMRVLLEIEDTKLFQKIMYSMFFKDGNVEQLKYVPWSALPDRIKKIAYRYPDLKFVQESAGLTNTETAFLNVLHYIEYISQFRAFFNRLKECPRSLFELFLNISFNDFYQITRFSGNLRSKGFLRNDGYISNDLMEVIFHQSMYLYFSDIIQKCEELKTYELSSFAIDPAKTELMEAILKGSESCNILLHGAPGSGKTEFAKALAKASGLEVYTYQNITEIQGSKILEKLNAYVSMNQKNSILIIDEAEKLLATASMSSMFSFSTPSSSKGIVNMMLENSKSKVIWIVNYDECIDESTKRRFTFSHYFDPMTEIQLREIASNKITVLNLNSDVHERILNLFGKYKVSGSSVDNVIKALKSIGTENAESRVEIILKENSELQYGRHRMRETVKASYDSSVLNTTFLPEKILKMARNNAKYSAKYPGKDSGFRILFYGPSGTGKTELARYISQQLGKSICLKRPSDILEKYVGESEKKIAQAFGECERTGSILLFDEADSFFADRNQAEHSWERTQVNEFLTQMEEFRGIIICTTNLRNIMDDAMQRRFDLLVEFKPLTEEGITVLLGKFYPDFKFTPDQIHEIADYETATPGDFSALEHKIRFMDEEDVTSDFIVEEILRLQEEKCKGEQRHYCIGFSA